LVLEAEYTWTTFLLFNYQIPWQLTNTAAYLLSEVGKCL
jgi:hypothetical protein